MRKMILGALLLSVSLFGASPALEPKVDTAKIAAQAKAEAEARIKADEQALSRAYAKEFAFLKAQKESLKNQLNTQASRNDAKLSAARTDVDKLEDKLLGFEVKIDAGQERLLKAQQAEQGSIDTSAIVDGTVTQAKATLDPYDITFKFDSDLSYSAKMAQIFERSLKLVNDLAAVTKTSGSFYLQDGSKAEGEIIKIGNIAAYGTSPKASGALAPAGNGKYKLWNAPEAMDTANMLSKSQTPAPMHIFIYENLKKEVEYSTEQTALEVIDSGGIIGWIIVGLGLLGLLFIFIRMALLVIAGKNTESMTKAVMSKIENGASSEEALKSIESKNGSVARVIKATLRNLDRDRLHLEDIISEHMLNETSRLDRFNSIILVFAAVAPLLGLLGTVTGMIATFDIITEYGTGDPKLLAGGISIALVTTELGLIVAIPLLLIGNLLSGWSGSIKDKMEHSALSIVNIYHKRNG
ncbi:MAG: MotA/TolQ/ExbB proton channel family protein [Campylobacterota bacterium]|nr:MotA/TolQ/ExbB proton channel family protein [Campylobacterota bacterium]